jgi:hypothetical protein
MRGDAAQSHNTLRVRLLGVRRPQGLCLISSLSFVRGKISSCSPVSVVNVKFLLALDLKLVENLAILLQIEAFFSIFPVYRIFQWNNS